MSRDKLHQVTVRLQAGGIGIIEVDGVDISRNIQSISVVAHAGQANEVTIAFIGEVDLIADGCKVVKE